VREEHQAAVDIKDPEDYKAPFPWQAKPSVDVPSSVLAKAGMPHWTWTLEITMKKLAKESMAMIGLMMFKSKKRGH